MGSINLREVLKKRHYDLLDIGENMNVAMLQVISGVLQTKQGSRPSCPDQEGRRGSEEVLPENFGVPLEGDRDVGALCGSHQG